MPCYRPLRAFQDEDGRVTFRAGAPDRRIELPCGRCIGCAATRANVWTVRCVHESQMHERSSFVTLTYDEAHVPEDHSLELRDWQLFAKRLREAVGPFRFFCAGEYGERHLRPHFHAILFGLDFAQDRVLVKRAKGRALWTSACLAAAWKNGFVSIGDVTPESVAYVTRYAIKKQSPRWYRVNRVDADTGECWTVRPEFQVMSRRPGLGAGWFDRYWRDVYPSDQVVLGGRTVRPPRYYDLRLEQVLPGGEGQSLLDEMKVARRRSSMERCEDATPERLQVRERLAESRLAHLGR